MTNYNENNKSVMLSFDNWEFITSLKREFRISSINNLIDLILPHLRGILEKEKILKLRKKTK